MPRLLYLAFPTGEISGGQKMILRHVETLRDLGFDAVCWQTAAGAATTWLEHRAPIEVGTPFRPDDILIVPSDAPNALASVAGMPQRALVFCQNQFSFATVGYAAMDRFPAERFPTFIAVGPTCAASIQRSFPQAKIEFIPSYANEQIFRPREKQHAVALSPRKRPMEAQAIRNLLARRHPRHADIPWRAVSDATEAQVAEVFGSSALFLSLSRFEAAPMTPMEAMASGCLCAGFTGIGGWDFSTPENGFWAAEDDLEAAADGLAQAADIVVAGGPELARRQEAGFATARQWSYANFRSVLEEVWMRLAPEARLRQGALD